MESWADKGGRALARGQNTATSLGTTLTSGGSVNTYGSWVDIGGTATFAYESITLGISYSTVSASYLLDIGISDGSNRTIIADALSLVGRSTQEGGTCAIALALHVPQGSQISARIQSSVASATMSFCIYGHSTGIFGMPGYARVVRLSDLNGSKGVAIDPGGTANTKVRTEIVSSTGEAVKAIFALVGANADFGRVPGYSLFDIEMGASGSEQVLLQNLGMAIAILNDFWFPGFFGPWLQPIAAGSRMSINAQCSIITAGDRTFDIVVYGYQ